MHCTHYTGRKYAAWYMEKTWIIQKLKHGMKLGWWCVQSRAAQGLAFWLWFNAHACMLSEWVCGCAENGSIISLWHLRKMCIQNTTLLQYSMLCLSLLIRDVLCALWNIKKPSVMTITKIMANYCCLMHFPRTDRISTDRFAIAWPMKIIQSDKYAQFAHIQKQTRFFVLSQKSRARNKVKGRHHFVWMKIENRFLTWWVWMWIFW